MKKEEAATITLVLIIFLIASLLWFSSCVTPEKAQRVLEKKQVLAKVCAEKYPVKIEYIKGDSVITVDTIYSGSDVIFDTVYHIGTDTVVVTKTIPITKTITKTIHVVDTLVKENTAAVEAAKVALINCDKKYSALFLQHEALTAKLDKVKKTRSTYFWLLLLSVGLLFRKPLIKLLRPVI